MKLADDPAIAALKILVATVFPAGFPCYVLYLLDRRIRRFTTDIAARLSRLEKKLDPDRTSSELREDGSDPPGGST